MQKVIENLPAFLCFIGIYTVIMIVFYVIPVFIFFNRKQFSNNKKQDYATT